MVAKAFTYYFHFFNYSTLLLLLTNFTSIYANNSQSILSIKDSTKIVIYSEFIKIEEANLNNIYNRQAGFEQIGKLCYSVSVDDMYKSCMLDYKNYNKYWFILIDKDSNIDEVRKYKRDDTKKKDFRFDVVIYNNSTITTPKNFSDFSVPVFSVNQQIFDFLVTMDIRSEQGNSVTHIKYVPITQDSLGKFTSISSFIIAGLLVGIILWWHIVTFRMYRNDGLILQKSMIILPWILFVNMCLYLYYNMGLKGDEANSMVAVYFGSIIVTIDSVFLTFFWFFAYLIGIGLSTYRSSFSRIELRRLIFVYIIIYILVCFDQLIEIIVPGQLSVKNLTITDIKNIILAIGLCTWVLIKSFMTGKKIILKMNYARVFSPEFLPSLKLKLSMIKTHTFYIVFFTLINISVIYSYKVFLIDVIARTSYINMTHMVYFIFMVCYLYLYRARRFPQYFHLGFDDVEDQNISQNNNINLYKLDLPSTDILRLQSDFGEQIGKGISKKELKDIDETPNPPFVIVNPIFPDQDQRFNIMDHMNIAYKLAEPKKK